MHNPKTLGAPPLQVPPSSPDAAEQATASAGLGLAVLAGFCRVPALAASQEIIEKSPLLLRVMLPAPLER